MCMYSTQPRKAMFSWRFASVLITPRSKVRQHSKHTDTMRAGPTTQNAHRKKNSSQAGRKYVYFTADVLKVGQVLIFRQKKKTQKCVRRPSASAITRAAKNTVNYWCSTTETTCVRRPSASHNTGKNNTVNIVGARQRRRQRPTARPPLSVHCTPTTTRGDNLPWRIFEP